MECVTTTSLLVLINGLPTEPFIPGRGLRQGDPLSPFLFILGAEVLARKIQWKNMQPKSVIGMPISRGGIRIPFLFFANDTIGFCKANMTACNELKRILDE